MNSSLKTRFVLTIAAASLTITSAAQAQSDSLASISKPSGVKQSDPSDGKNLTPANVSQVEATTPAPGTPIQTAPVTAPASVKSGVQNPAGSAGAAAPTSVGIPTGGAVDSEPSGASQLLTRTYDVYRTNPTPATFSEMLKAIKQLLSQPGIQHMPAAQILKTYPILADLGARALDAGAGRIWTFQRVPVSKDVVAQWVETKSVVTLVGRRHKTKKVTSTSTWHTQILPLPFTVTLKEARVLSSLIVLIGDDRGSTLWLHAFRQNEGNWVESPGYFDSVPSFLKENVSGKVAFRGPDLIFNVAKAVPGSATGIINSTIPEAESATYKFWLHLTENGYVLEQRLPDEEQFSAVRQFLDAVATNHTETAKGLLADPKLIAIPRYVGVQSQTSGSRVTEMASPPAGAIRYRIVSGGKNDLIFDVGRAKDRLVIKAIFIAPPDKWLQEIARVLPSYSHFAPPPPKPADAPIVSGANH